MKAETYDMIVTSKVGNLKLKATIIVENELNDKDECIGEIQGNFLWENFDFEMIKTGETELPENSPINIYEDAEDVTKQEIELYIPIQEILDVAKMYGITLPTPFTEEHRRKFCRHMMDYMAEGDWGDRHKETWTDVFNETELFEEIDNASI
jgi:hypothetical protein